MTQPTPNFPDQVQRILERTNTTELQHQNWSTVTLAQQKRNKTIAPDSKSEDSGGYVQTPDYTKDSTSDLYSSDSGDSIEPYDRPSDILGELLSENSSDSDDDILSQDSFKLDARTAPSTHRSRMDHLTLEYERSLDESLVKLVEEGERWKEVQGEIRRLMEEQEVQHEKEWEQEEDDGCSGFPYRLLG